MITLITGSIVLSLLHGIIPNHWLPVLAISKKEKWDLAETTRVTLIAGLAHAASTVLIGVLLAFIGAQLAEVVENFTAYVAPALLVALGLFYVYQHNRHHHFHMHGEPKLASNKNRIIFSLASAMFFSPCFEIEAYFLVAGAEGLWLFALLALLYTVVSVGGMIVWVRLTHGGLLKMNWHSLEHNAGIITGITLILSGILTFFLH
jgi:nickel/cobalt transporter (NicO) family protein